MDWRNQTRARSTFRELSRYFSSHSNDVPLQHQIQRSSCSRLPCMSRPIGNSSRESVIGSAQWFIRDMIRAFVPTIGSFVA